MKITSAEFSRAAQTPDHFIDDGRPEIAFAGRSNVGKSSLLNCLLGRKSLARTSSTPGRTQAINYFLINDRVYFVDLPGYGYAKISKQERQRWADLIGDYLSVKGPEGRFVLLVDGKVGATPLDVQAYEYLNHFGIEPIVVATKIDKVKRSRRHASLSDIRRKMMLGNNDLIACSAESKEGIKELWQAIQKWS